MRPAEVLIVGLPGPSLGRSETRLLRRLQPGGVILFRHNVAGAGELQALIAELRRLLPRTLLYLDAEGGRVARLAGLVGPAPAAARLAVAPPPLAARAGRWTGQALRLFGFDVDLAPVVDLDRGRGDNSLDGRYLGDRAAPVIARGRAFLRGLHAAGVGGCVKHFPGLGAAEQDTHHRPARVDLGQEALHEDLRPFIALAPLAGAVLVAHAIYQAWDREGRPASLSPAVATGLLRHRLRFRGVALADDLEMQALAPWGSLPEVAAAAFLAGCDLLPVCHTLEAAPEIAARLGRARYVPRLHEATPRIRRFRRHLATLRRGAVPPARLTTIQTRLRAINVALGTPHEV